jgi:hypothetical protein
MPPLPPEPPVDEYAQDRLDQEAKDLPEFADFEHSNFQPRGAYGRPVSAKRKARRDDLGDINENLLYIATAPESQFERIDPGDRELILRRREQLRAHAGYGREDSEAVMADRRSGAARARYLQAARIDEEAISRLAELSGASEDELRAGAVADYRRYLDDYDSGASADDPVVKTNRWLEAEIGKREAELQREEALPEGWSLTQGAARMAGLAGPNEPFSAFQATIQGVKETFGTLIQARAQMAEALGAPSIYAKPPKSSVFEQLKWRPKKPADTNRAYRSFPAALAEGFGVPVERGAPKASTMWQVDPETGETIPPNTVQFALDSLGGFTGAIANLMLARGAIAGLTRGAAARGAASFAARGTKGGRLAAALADDVPMFIASGIIGRALSGEKLTGEGGALDLDAVGVDALVGALNSGAAMAVNELAPFVARKTAKGRNLSQLVGEREAINRVSPQLAKMLDDMPPDSFAAKALASTIERALVDGTVRNSTTAARAVGDFATGYAIDKWNGIPEEEAVVQGILFSLIGLRHSQGRPAREVVEQVDAVRAARARGENVQLPPALAAAEADMRRTYEDARLQFNQAILGDEAFRDLGGDALWADETRRTFETLGREAGLAPVARDLEADAAKGLRETREAGIFYPTPDEKNVLRFFREDSEEAGSPFPGEKRLARALYSELPKGALEAHLASGGTIKSAALGHFKAFKNQEKSALAELKKLSESAFGGAGPKDFEDRSKKIQEKLTKARRGRDRWKNQLIDARLLDEAERAESEKAAKKVGARKGAGKSPDGEAPGDGGGPAAGPGAPVAPTSPAGSPPKPQKPIKVEKDLASIYNSLVHKHKKGTALSTKERGELQDAINKIQALGPRYDTGKFGKTVDEALTGRKPGSPATSATVAAPTSPLSTAREARAARFAPLPTEAATATKPVVAPGAEPTTPAAPTAPPPTSLRERLEAAGRDRETAFLAKARSQNALDAEENRRNIEQQDSETAALQKAVGKAEAKVRAKAEAVAAAELAAATGKPGATKTKKVEAAQKALEKSQKALAKAEADFEAARDEMNDLDEERDYLATNPVPATDQLRAVYQSLADAADRVESDSDAFLLEEAARNAQDVFSRYNLERKSSNPSRLRTLLDKVEPAEEEVVGPTDEQLAAAKRRDEAQVRREAEDARAAAEEAQAALEKALAEEDEGNIADAEDVLAEAKAKLKAAEADLAQGRAEDAGGSEPAPVAPSSPKEAATTPELLKLDKAEKEALRKFYDLESEIKDRRSLLKSYQGALGESGGRLPKELGGGKITQEKTRYLTSAVRDLEEEKDSILENIFEIRKDILKSSKDSSPDFGIGYIVKLTEDKNKAKKKRDTISAEIKDIQSRVMSYQIYTDLGLRIPKEIIHGKLIDPEEYTKNSESRLSGLHKEDDDISIRLVEMQKAIDEYNKSRFKDPDLLAAKPESVAPAPTSTRISPAKAAVEAVAADPALTPETKAAVEAVAALTEAGALPENNAAKEPTPEQMAQAEEVQRAEREDYERRIAEEEAERLRLDEERQAETAAEEPVARPAEASVPEPAPVVEPAKVAAEIDIKGGTGPVAYWYSEGLKRKTSEAERAGFAPDKVGVVRAIVGDMAEVMTRKGKVMRVPVADLLTDGSAAGFRDPEGVNWRSAYKMDSTVRWQSPSTKETFTGRIVDRDMRVRLHSPGAVEEPHVRIAFEAKRDGAPLKKTEWIPESHISLAIIRPEKSPKLVGEAVDQAVAERVWKDVAAKKGRREDWRVDLRQLLLNQPRLDSAVRTPWPNRAEFRDNSDAALPHIALLAELQKTAGHDFGTRFVNDFLTAPKYGNRELDRATAALIKYSNDIGFERLDFESLVDFQFARDLAVAWKNAHDANKIQGAPKIIHPVDKLLQTGETVLGKKFDALLERVHETLKASYRASDSIAKSINDTFIKLHGKGRC